jgi:hypothetical protein
VAVLQEELGHRDIALMRRHLVGEVWRVRCVYHASIANREKEFRISVRVILSHSGSAPGSPGWSGLPTHESVTDVSAVRWGPLERQCLMHLHHHIWHTLCTIVAKNAVSTKSYPDQKSLVSHVQGGVVHGGELCSAVTP